MNDSQSLEPQHLLQLQYELVSWTPRTGEERERFPPGTWSVSRVRNAAKCLRAFDQRYNQATDKDKDTDRIGADLGSAVHVALERTYLWVEDEEYSGKFPRHIAFRHLRECMAEAGLFNEDLFAAARKMILNHAAVQGDVDFMSLLGAEVEFRITIGGIPFGGYIDRVDMITPDGEPSNSDVTLRDYKSAKWLMTNVEVEHDLQASVYMAAARLAFPGKRIHFVFDMLRHGLILEAEDSDERIASAFDYIKMIVDRATAEPEGDAERYPATITPLCSWCEYRSGCDAYRAMLANDPTFTQPSESDLEAMVIERNRLSSISMATRQASQKIEAALKRPLAQMEKDRRKVAKAVKKGRTAAKKAHKGKSDAVIEAEAMKLAAAELDMRIHEMHEVMSRESLHAGDYVVRIAKQKRPAHASYNAAKVARVLEELDICDAETAHSKIQMVSTRKLSRLITERTEGWREPDRIAARLEVEAMGKMSHESRLDIRHKRS